MKSIEREVENILKQKHADAIFLADNNLRIARRNEEFSKWEQEEIDKTIYLANCLADEVDVTKERIELAEIRAKKFLVLKKIGMTKKDIEPRFECEKCQDTGKNSCECKIKILNELLLKRSGIIGELEDFKNARFTDMNGERLFNKLQEWSQKFPDITKKMIYIAGGTGVGKTFLLKCIANELIRNGNYIFYSTAFNMNNDFLEYCKASAEDKAYFLAPYLESEVLLIDDLGTEPILNNITLDYLYLILNERLIADKATIINSNLSLEQLIDRYGERIFSRIIDKRVGWAINFEGEDKRLRK